MTVGTSQAVDAFTLQGEPSTQDAARRCLWVVPCPVLLGCLKNEWRRRSGLALCSRTVRWSPYSGRRIREAEGRTQCRASRSVVKGYKGYPLFCSVLLLGFGVFRETKDCPFPIGENRVRAAGRVLEPSAFAVLQVLHWYLGSAPLAFIAFGVGCRQAARMLRIDMQPN